MKYPRLLVGLALGVTLFSCHGQAQEDNILKASSSLQSVLSILQESVQKLSLDNDQLAARDNAVKDQIQQLQQQLAQLEDQGDVLKQAADQLKAKTPRRSQKIARLENENADLDDRAQKASDMIKSTQQSLEAGYKQNQALLLKLKELQNIQPPPPPPPSPEDLAAIRVQKEKLKLMKMIYDSQARQAAVQQSIIDFQKNAPILPTAGLLAHQQLLQQQIKDLETQIAAYATPVPASAVNPVPPVHADDAQMSQLELELKALEKNYAQMKDLMEKMSQKAQAARLSVGEHLEEEKLQNALEDMRHQGIGLRAELDDLRSQMIDMDKRKSHLEVMIQHLP